MGAILSDHMEVQTALILFKDGTTNALNNVDRASIVEEILRPGSKLVASTNYFKS